MLTARLFLSPILSIGCSLKSHQQIKANENNYSTNWAFNSYDINTKLHLNKMAIVLSNKQLIEESKILHNNITVGIEFSL